MKKLLTSMRSFNVSAFAGILQFALLLYLLNNSVFAQMVGGGQSGQISNSNTLNTMGFSGNFTGQNQDVGTGVSLVINNVYPNKVVFGLEDKFYYKHFNNAEYNINVTNMTLFLPIYCGYEFSFDKFKIIPAAGLFGAMAIQSSDVAGGHVAEILDWGYMGEVKLGYTLSENSSSMFFISAAYYNNFDSHDYNGHFFKSIPLSIGFSFKKAIKKN